jgi:hypothetical protein
MQSSTLAIDKLPCVDGIISPQDTWQSLDKTLSHAFPLLREALDLKKQNGRYEEVIFFAIAILAEQIIHREISRCEVNDGRHCDWHHVNWIRGTTFDTDIYMSVFIFSYISAKLVYREMLTYVL